jgi:hypothetical protein
MDRAMNNVRQKNLAAIDPEAAAPEAVRESSD